MTNINPIIWEELQNIDAEDSVKKFITDLLIYERKYMNYERVRFSDFYDKQIEKNVTSGIVSETI